MKCPHCLTDFHDFEVAHPIGEDKDGHWGVTERTCSACNRLILEVIAASENFFYAAGHSGYFPESITARYLVRPKASNRTPPSPEVPAQYASDYVEGCLVLADSPKASAALSRRCLQHILRDTAKVKPQDLILEIQEVIDRGTLPSHIAESLDAVRVIGNFAAHPIKSTSTGEIVEVEPGEAEWNLDTLEALFDFYFVQPAIIQKKKAALNAKLKSVGKKPIK